jgi:hypothetical protein
VTDRQVGAPSQHRSRTTWARPANRIPHRDRWRSRETGWRKQHILMLQRDGRTLRPFNRYDYYRAWHDQQGKCGLCDLPLPTNYLEAVGSLVGWVGTGGGINPDHDHRSHRFRSLVHGFCNRSIGGHTQHSALLLINYLLKHGPRECP